MTRLAFFFQLGAAGVLAVPALVDGKQADGLEASLARTLTALEELVEIESAADGGIDVDRVLAAVPAPVLDERERKERLASLTSEISRLKELLRTRATATLPVPVPVPVPVPDPDPDPDPDPVVEVDEQPAQPIVATPVTPEPRAFEEPGFSADPLRQGRAYFHAEQYEDAIAAFEKLGDDPAGAYWIGRSLERLGQSTRALEHYRRVAESEEAGSLRERAAQDLEFLEWKVRFEQRRRSRGETKRGASR